MVSRDAVARARLRSTDEAEARGGVSAPTSAPTPARKAGETRVRKVRTETYVLRTNHTVTNGTAGASYHYLHRGDEQVRVAHDGTLDRWQAHTPVTTVMLSPERKHALPELARDVAANLGVESGDWHAVRHGGRGDHQHLHMVFKGSISDERINEAVRGALAQRHERAVAWAREQRTREQQRGRGHERGDGMSR